jgi:peptidoglycan/xylan/chitin deacetylase (PgdA/CDA1 family)
MNAESSYSDSSQAPSPDAGSKPGGLRIPGLGRMSGLLKGRGLWNASGPGGVFMPAPVFIYHAVTDDDAPAGSNGEYLLARRRFVEHLDLLGRCGAATVDLDRLTHRAPPGDGVALTFDDGCISWVRVVAPLLAQRGLRATFFLIANPAYRHQGSRASRQALTWGDVRELTSIHGRDGAPLFGIGSHGCRHMNLPALLRRGGPHAVLEELRDSRRRIEDALSQPCRLLSLPGGRMDRDDATQRALLWIIREAGFDVVRGSTPSYDQDPRVGLMGGSPVYSHTTASMLRFELARLRQGNWISVAHWTWLRATGRWREGESSGRRAAALDGTLSSYGTPALDATLSVPGAPPDRRERRRTDA